MNRADALTGSLLGGKYRLGEVIGAGGMGKVYEAQHLELKTACAVKIVHAQRETPLHARRLLREARALAELSSPYAVRVLDVGRMLDGSPYVVMERLEGRPLNRWLEDEGSLSVTLAIEFSIQICEVLSEAHARGIVHRDLKPSNVFVVDRAGRHSVKVLDFGLAKRFEGESSDSTATASEFAGSPRYMSPEQIRSSRDVKPQSDIWSLGILMFEMISGTVPFLGENSAGTLASIVADTPKRLRQLVPDVPPELDRLVADCLEKHAADRPKSAAAVLRRLSELEVPRHGRETTPMAVVGMREASATLDPEEPTTVVGSTVELPQVQQRPRSMKRWPWLGAAALLGAALTTWWAVSPSAETPDVSLDRSQQAASFKPRGSESGDAATARRKSIEPAERQPGRSGEAPKQSMATEREPVEGMRSGPVNHERPKPRPPVRAAAAVYAPVAEVPAATFMRPPPAPIAAEPALAALPERGADGASTALPAPPESLDEKGTPAAPDIAEAIRTRH